MKELTPEQHQAVHSERARFTVLASAGAGKTLVLVQRYLKHVFQDGMKADQILTITFTRKAAAEMKRRIVMELVQKGRTDQAQIAETGPIQTIHSFCERILRENALVAGNDPTFEVLGESQATALLDEALGHVLGSPLDELPYASKLMSRLAGRYDYRTPRLLHGALREAVLGLLSNFRASGIEPVKLEAIYVSPGTVLAAWQEKMLIEPPFSAVQLDPPIEPEQFFPWVAHQLKNQGLRPPSWFKPGTAQADREESENTCGLMQIVLSVWERFEAAMSHLQQFDFTELERRAVALLEGVPEAQQRLRRQYRAVLVDESQDVNPVQYRLIDALGAEAEMLVGDPKQSIYGFRFADRKLFVERASQLSRHQLSKNFRSLEGILRFVDLFFGKIWGEDYLPSLPPGLEQESNQKDRKTDASFEGVELWPQTGKAPDYAQISLWIKELTTEFKPQDIAVLVRRSKEAGLIEAQLQNLNVPCKVSTEKFYTRLEIRDLANALNACTDPSEDFSLLAMLHSPVVGLSLDSVVLLAAGGAVFPQLKNFEPSLEEEQQVFDRFKQWYFSLVSYADRLPAWELISEIFCQSPYLENLARRPAAQQTLANVRKMLSMAVDEPSLKPKEFAERIRHIQMIPHREGDAPSLNEDADAVTLMTIHKAKGLEFPVVVLPDMTRGVSGRTTAVVNDAIQGMVATKFGPLPCVYHQWLTEQQKVIAAQEELRVLYVAMTRAQKRLCVTIDPNKNERTLAGQLASAVGYPEQGLPGVLLRKSP